MGADAEMNIVVVDDEIEIREGLRCLIESLEQGDRYKVAAVCASGPEALEALSLYAVDVLLTDIRMAQMDGLTLIELAKAQYPSMQVMVLSGYSQFEYAQKAVKLQACDYLLKPVKKEELAAALNKLYEQVELQKQSKLYMDWEDFQHAQRSYAAIVAIDYNEESGEQVMGLAADARLTEIASRSEPLSAAEYHSSSTAPALQNGLKEMIMQLPQTYILKGFVHKMADNLVIGIQGETAEEAEGRLAAVVGRVKDYQSAAGRSIRIGCSEISKQSGYIHSLYLHACTALAERLLHTDEDRTAAYQYALQSFDETSFQLDLARMDAAWETLEFSALQDEVVRLVQSAVEHGDVRFLIWTINTIMLTLNEKVKKYNHLNEAISYDLSTFLFKILWCRSAVELEQFMLTRMKELLSHLSPDRREGQIVLKAKQYIQAHLHEQLSLAEISKEACVSVGYLSRLFREKTGSTFLEYLTGKRIEQAKELLASPGVKVYEVAEQVGYGSWKHFSRTFKEQTGQTPAEYRQNVSI